MNIRNYINCIFFFNQKDKPLIKIVFAHKYGQAKAVKALKEEFGEDIEITDLMLEGEKNLTYYLAQVLSKSLYMSKMERFNISHYPLHSTQSVLQ
jgi:menaquinone-dependent protoporphyrinogen IX oxidase